MHTAKSMARPQKRGRGAAGASDSNMVPVQDARFASAEWDPRFSRVPKRAKKAIEDERFQNELKSNPAFRPRSTTVDRFGRPKGKVAHLDRSLREIVAESEDSSSESDEEITARVKEVAEPVFGVDESSDESDSEDGEFDGEEELEEIPRGKATRRLAVMGLDWSSTRAVDIFVSLDSFCPPGKHVEFVEVHPSKFGLERLATEAKLGPQVVAKRDLEVVKEAQKQQLISSTEKDVREGECGDVLSNDEDRSGSEDGSDASDEDCDAEETLWKSQAALRKYEEERLKYYYGVVSFEDIRAADAVYEQCDGVEYAQSGRAFDLRFIPDEMVIETKARDRADKIPDGYAPPNVTPSSLNNSRVKLSWDADGPDRVILKKKAIGKQKLDEENLKMYLAGSSEEEKGDIEKRRNLLLGGLEEEEKPNEGMDMEITFEPGMLEKGEEIVKRKHEREERTEETEWEGRLRRQQERKAAKRRAWREALTQKGRDALDEGDDEDEATALGENRAFDDDPFFSVERDLDEAEEAERKRDKKGERKKKAKAQPGTETVNELSKSSAQNEAELELLAMPDLRNPGLITTGADARRDSDEEGGRARTKRSRRRERAAKQAAGVKAAERSALDVEDGRFKRVFDSHLFALDPTHAKFRDDATTRRIVDEKMRRIGRGEEAKREDDGGKEEVSEAMRLVAGIKARAARRKERRKSGGK